MNARAALPQNCSFMNLVPVRVSENSTPVPQATPKVPPDLHLQTTGNTRVVQKRRRPGENGSFCRICRRDIPERIAAQGKWSLDLYVLSARGDCFPQLPTRSRLSSRFIPQEGQFVCHVVDQL